LASNEFYKIKYKNILLDYNEWIKKAEQLIDVAELLEPKVEETWKDWAKWGRGNQQQPLMDDRYVSIYFMLSSYALENLFKARIIKLKRNTLDNSLTFPDILKNHDLYKLSKESGLADLASKEEELLKKLTRSAVWYGRYPIPVKPEKFNPIVFSESEEVPMSLSSYTNSDHKRIKRIVNEIKDTLK
jgi:hypothetical protein